MRKGTRTTGAAMLAAALCLALAGATAEEATGDSAIVARVKTATAPADILRGDQRIPATLGLPLQRGDRLSTGPGGALGVTFVDDMVITAGSNSEIAIDQFVFDPAADRLGFGASVGRGTMQLFSGRLARLAPDRAKVTTPTATIGIRGTRFLVRVTGEAR